MAAVVFSVLRCPGSAVVGALGLGLGVSFPVHPNYYVRVRIINPPNGDQFGAP